MVMSGSNGRGGRGFKRRTVRPPTTVKSTRRSLNGGGVFWTIPSDYESARDVQKDLTDLVGRAHFTEHNLFAIKLALEEAIINAVKHGNKLDASKKVTVEAWIKKDQIEIMIEDEGPGFDRARVPDPTLEENLEKCSGRGILLIESYMDEVTWDRGGKRLRMVKRNRDDTLPRK